MLVLQLKIYKTSAWWGSVPSGASTWSQQQGHQCRLKTVASAAGLLMISFGSSVIFSQQTAAYCLLLGGIKLCVLVGCRGGGGAFCVIWAIDCFFHSSGTIMRFFFPPEYQCRHSAHWLCLWNCAYISQCWSRGRESYFQNISKLFSVIVQRLIRVCVV